MWAVRSPSPKTHARERDFYCVLTVFCFVWAGGGGVYIYVYACIYMFFLCLYSMSCFALSGRRDVYMMQACGPELQIGRVVQFPLVRGDWATPLEPLAAPLARAVGVYLANILRRFGNPPA